MTRLAYAKGGMNHESALEGAAKYYVSALAVARTSLQDVVAFMFVAYRKPCDLRGGGGIV
jgi:hypothetical protein